MNGKNEKIDFFRNVRMECRLIYAYEVIFCYGSGALCSGILL